MGLAIAWGSSAWQLGASGSAEMAAGKGSHSSTLNWLEMLLIVSPASTMYVSHTAARRENHGFAALVKQCTFSDLLRAAKWVGSG